MAIDFTYSKHALTRMDQRGITKDQINFVLRNPDSIVDQTDKNNGYHIYQAVLESETKKGNNYLLRVFINTDKTPKLVITAYKTSKIEKYL